MAVVSRYSIDSRSDDRVAPVRPVRPTTLLVTALIGVVALMLWAQLIAPAARTVLELYRGMTSIPSVLQTPQLGALGANLLSGAVVGFVVGLIRMRVRNSAIEAMVDAVGSPELVTAGRLRAGCAVLHVLLGTIAGSVLGMLQIPPLGQVLRGDLSLLSDPANSLAVALTEMGMFNGGGAPPARPEMWVFFILLALLVALITALIALPVVVSLGALGNALIASSSKAAGSALGTAALLTATGLRERSGTLLIEMYREERVRRSIRNTFIESLWSGLATTVLAAMAVSLASSRVAPQIGMQVQVRRGPTWELPRPELSSLALSGDGDTIYLVSQYTQYTWTLDDDGVAYPGGAQWPAHIRVPDISGAGDGRSSRPFEVLQEGAALLWSGDGLVVRDARTEAVISRLAGADSVYYQVQSARNGWLVAGRAMYSASLMVWDGRSGAATGMISLPSRYGSFAVSPDGRWIAQSWGDWIQIWDARTLRPTRRLSGTAGALAFSPNGRLLASAGRPVRLWDVETGRAIWGSRTRPSPDQINIYYDTAGPPLRASDLAEVATGVALGDSVLVTVSRETVRVYRLRFAME